MFHGSIVALVTPFRNGAIDEEAFAAPGRVADRRGHQGSCPSAPPARPPTLSHDEHERVVELCIETAAGRAPVIAGAGSNSTDEAIEPGPARQAAGADGALVVTPYYNKPTQDGLYAHYRAINDAVDLPLLIYNIPGRSVVDMSVETMARLAKLPEHRRRQGRHRRPRPRRS